MPAHPDHPLVVASVNNPSDLCDLQQIDPNAICDVVEFRLDGLPDRESTTAAVKACTLPVILTARRPDEGAFSELSLSERVQRIAPLLSPDCWVDLECRTLAENEAEINQLVDTIQSQSSGMIASYHDFESVPDVNKISELANIAGKHDAVLKIACTVNSPSELSQWAQALEELSSLGLPFSFMGMGKFGMASRVAAASQGSLFNYGFLSKASVPGQWPAKALKQAFTFLHVSA